MSFKFQVSGFKFMKLTNVISVILLVVASVIAAFAQNDGSEQNVTGRPGTFAIVGARVVTVSGAVRGT